MKTVLRVEEQKASLRAFEILEELKTLRLKSRFETYRLTKRGREAVARAGGSVAVGSETVDVLKIVELDAWGDKLEEMGILRVCFN